VNAVMNLGFNLSSGFTIGGLSSTAQLHIVILYICILSHIAISLPLFFSVFCAAYWCFLKTLLVFSTLCRFLNFKL
jgi:hypothetical protein